MVAYIAADGLRIIEPEIAQLAGDQKRSRVWASRRNAWSRRVLGNQSGRDRQRGPQPRRTMGRG